VIRRFQYVILLLAISSGLGCQITNLTALFVPTATPTPTTRPRSTTVAPIPQAVVVPTIPPPPPTQPPPPVTATITEDNLRVRAAPNTSGAILDRLSRGATVQVIGRLAANDWLQIIQTQKPDTPGWVSAQFVRVNGSLDTVPIVQPGQPGSTPARPPSPPYPPPYP